MKKDTQLIIPKNFHFFWRGPSNNFVLLGENFRGVTKTFFWPPSPAASNTEKVQYPGPCFSDAKRLLLVEKEKVCINEHYIKVPAPSKGCQLNRKGWWIDTLEEPFGTLWTFRYINKMSFWHLQTLLGWEWIIPNMTHTHTHIIFSAMSNTFLVSRPLQELTPTLSTSFSGQARKQVLSWLLVVCHMSVSIAIVTHQPESIFSIRTPTREEASRR